MKAGWRYLAAAFNARPFGMSIPPNWFAVAAFVLLGIALNPGFLAIGAGLEGLYLWSLTRSRRFRAAIDAARRPDGWQTRYDKVSVRLGAAAHGEQHALEGQLADVRALLTRSGDMQAQVAGLRQMAWLHMRLLAARDDLSQVLEAARRERAELDRRYKRLEERLGETAIDAELRRSLEQQRTLISERRMAHTEAHDRRALVDAEIERLRQQVALVREQALLATDEATVAQSLDVLVASLNEANRWVQDQRELFAGLDDLAGDAPPEHLFGGQTQYAGRARRTGETQ